jgi:hypothetical protein
MVVSAMRQTHPQAITLVLSRYPEIDEALSAIRMQGGRSPRAAVSAAQSRGTPMACGSFAALSFDPPPADF